MTSDTLPRNVTPKEKDLVPSLRYSVEWRAHLWLRPLKYVIGNPARFAGRRVLDLGCRFGKMACWFAAQGAIVDGVDVSREAIDLASAEQSRWRIGKDVLSFRAFDGNLANLPLGEYDFVFTKSVLTVLRDRNPIQFLSSVPALLKPGGHYLAVENAAAGFPVSFVRRWLHRRWNSSGSSFHGVDDAVLAHFRNHFGTVKYRRFWGLIVAIQARRSD